MRINSKARTQIATFDGSLAGEGLAIFLSQGGEDVSRYRFVVYAINSQMTLRVGEFFSSPPSATNPNGGLSRMLASCVCPGVESWAVEITCADVNVTPETADVTLLSSKCCTSPVGVKRVAERYFYQSSNIGAVVGIPPGRTLKRFSAIAGGAAGSVQMTPATAAVIAVPAGATVTGNPEANFIGLTQITFVNVSWFIEFLESA